MTTGGHGPMTTADDGGQGWLLFLTQLPASPSSARVALWRRLRAHGATSLLNGAWVLPRTGEHEKFFGQLAETVQVQGGRAFVLPVTGAAAETDEVIIARFQADREREYHELAERCDALLAELRKESAAGKFTFAELEENEQGLDKLVSWLARIQARDFRPAPLDPAPEDRLADCRQALEAFAQSVYRAEGVDPAD
ncbi:MAG: chromate resistance protein ChrB [Actinobacteria bacterium]|nr:chromate resistance protein ChrB [Actinomycetota bacterium]